MSGISNNCAKVQRPGLVAAVSAGALAASGLIALRRPVPAWEVELTEAINGAPDVWTTVLYPIMQLGTLAGPVVAAGVILVARRDVVGAAATVVAGVVTWFAAKGVKRLVDRDRPLEFLPGIDVREGDGTGLGFISGHSAVAALAAVMVIGALPRRWRWLPPLLAGLVGIARVVHGVHFPADLVGGWAFGTLVGLGALGVVDRLRPTPV